MFVVRFANNAAFIFLYIIIYYVLCLCDISYSYANIHKHVFTMFLSLNGFNADDAAAARHIVEDKVGSTSAK